MRLPHGPGAVLLLLIVCGCRAETADLSIDLRTDFVPGGVEFSTAETVLSRLGAEGPRTSVDVPAGAPVQSGLRIADLTGLEHGRWHLRVILRDGSGATVIERPVELRLDRHLGVTVVISRDCRGVQCPRADGDPALVACLGGRCASPECTPETLEACPPPECTSPADCTEGPACASGLCTGGSCLYVATDGACGPGEVCDLDGGCQPAPSRCAGVLFGRVAMIESPASALSTVSPHYIGASASLYAASPAPAGDFDLWVGTRAADGVTFSDWLNFSGVMPAINSSGHDLGPSSSYDDRVLAFASDRDDPGLAHLYLAVRPPGEPFGEPARIALTGSTELEREPALSADGLALYFAGMVSGDFDIFLTTRASRELPFGDAAPVAEVNSGLHEDGPFISADGLELWFTRQLSVGEVVIMRTTRDTPTGPWAPPAPVDEIGAFAPLNAAPALSADGTRLVFASFGPLPDTQADLYEAVRACP